MTFGLATLRTGDAALVVGEQLLPLKEHGDERDVLSLLVDWDRALPQLQAIAAAPRVALKLDESLLAAPYVPRQIFCTGANYRKHVIGLVMGDPSMRSSEEASETDSERLARVERLMDERAHSPPYCFIKLPSCVVGPTDAVILPRNVAKPDWELELGVVIGRRARHVPAERAMEHVAGFAIVNDVTAREHIFRRDAGAIGADWLSGKCFPTFLPFGPVVVPRQFVPDPYELMIRLVVNGRTFQDESTRDMLIGIERQVAYLSDRVELQPGDLICTGSPYGNGSAFGVFLEAGDVMEGTITGLGRQRNVCIAEEG